MPPRVLSSSYVHNIVYKVDPTRVVLRPLEAILNAASSTVVMRKLREEVPVQVSSSSSDRGSQLRVFEMIGIDFKILVPHCETKVDKIKFSSSEIVIMTVLALLLTLAAIATIADVIFKLKSEEEAYQERLAVPVRYLLCFSLYTNICRLLKKDTSPDSIKVFHGMKVITILWVILNHTYYYINYQALSECNSFA
ncbi:hypothetical protein AVEN_71142-1 [Araneus ventricosus]|uniref:Nose resistant to fluoxetine protein 6 n=1 Tax=Araneus ventricosus TaxID=182803 RepID=A0A4Y2SX28_ARAVE|nr:hypothetical protein AVEN_271821-1 [Araneus ventricosus]GBN92005.1 hypothetical protein AVEN_171263-1 [Araneus ventricosus]GBN92894.1 hypothetical protein AVEN_205034-1 [Araneus ventricosus]GBN92899.1 hypothetical protein AVEN_71142-1 [Araneus ventricosus]